MSNTFSLNLSDLIESTIFTPYGADANDMAYRADKFLNSLQYETGDVLEKKEALQRSLQRWIDMAEGCSIEKLEDNVAVLNGGAFFMGSTMLRDMALRTICERAEAAHTALRALIRHSGGEVQANALVCAALAKLVTGQEEEAYDILSISTDLHPKHSLVDLVWRSMEPGASRLSIENLCYASDMTWTITF
ncbi:DUF4192 family protein [Corynebacterium callunae]|uniref:Uncharacterized protein n=1 Tax=Corynebacterium callunae DSM 20147 TaxID=1121353 RepID=M1TV73_9CORY|nr:DUF4192 family protein [Corynebacterium callunae]AGG68106.1 hypothetical protein H924_13585 [Corynebacterium callunae DSM 20147]